jgi:intraflagellar transport protein 122
MVFSCDNEGGISMYKTDFSTVHGLYHDRYAYRELMTDVIIQHLVTETRVKIRCRDYIKRIAIYKDRLAVQLPEKIIIYSVNGDDQYDMKYKAYKKISKKVECNLLFVLSHHLVLCLDRKVQLLNFNGVLEREWVLDSIIRYMKVIGGPAKREGLILGCKNGAVMKIFIDNAFPIPLVKQTTPIRQVDISANREKVAVVDDYSNLFVYDIKTQQQLYKESGAISVAWNMEFEDILSYTGNGFLYIKT